MLESVHKFIFSCDCCILHFIYVTIFVILLSSFLLLIFVGIINVTVSTKKYICSFNRHNCSYTLTVCPVFVLQHQYQYILLIDGLGLMSMLHLHIVLMI